MLIEHAQSSVGCFGGSPNKLCLTVTWPTNDTGSSDDELDTPQVKVLEEPAGPSETTAEDPLEGPTGLVPAEEPLELSEEEEPPHSVLKNTGTKRSKNTIICT